MNIVDDSTITIKEQYRNLHVKLKRLASPYKIEYILKMKIPYNEGPISRTQKRILDFEKQYPELLV